MSFNSLKYLRHFIIYLIVLIYSTKVESKCRRFDDIALDSLNYDQLSGQWNIFATSLEGDSTASIAYNKVEDNSINFERKNISGHTDKGVIRELNQKRKLIHIGSEQFTFWVLKTDQNNYGVSYQCSKPVVVGNTVIGSKEIYRIWSRSESIDDSTYHQLKTFLEQISHNIHLSKVARSSHLTPKSSHTPHVIESQATTHSSESPQSSEKSPNLQINLKLKTGVPKLNILQPLIPDPKAVLEFGVLPPESTYVMPEIHLPNPRLPDKPNPREPGMRMEKPTIDSPPRFGNIDHRLSERFQNRKSESNRNMTIRPKSMPSKSGYISSEKGNMSHAVGDIVRTLEGNQYHLYPISIPSNKNYSPEQKKRCRRFDINGVTLIELKSLSGEWHTLYCSKSDKKSTLVTIRSIDETHSEYKKITNCGQTLTGLLTKKAQNNKLELTVDNKHSTIWAIDVGNHDYTVIYKCSKPSNNWVDIVEEYSIISRQKQISEQVVQNITNLLTRITNGITLEPLVVEDCDTKQKYESTTIPTPPENVKLPSEPLKDQKVGGSASVPAVVEPQIAVFDENCPIVEHVPLQYEDWDKISGLWFSQFFTDNLHNGFSIEIEKTESKTAFKRWTVYRFGSQINSTGIFEYSPDTGLISSDICGLGVGSFYILSTDFYTHMISYQCFADKPLQLTVWTRAKILDQNIILSIYETAKHLILRFGLNVELFTCSQNIIEHKSIVNELTCKDLTDKALLDVDISRIRGDWRSIMINLEGIKCVGLRENSDLLTDPYNRDEFWFDVLTEQGNQGVGRIKSYNERSLTHLSSSIPGERNFTILDTDYISYFVYYECNIVQIKGVPTKIEEYGLMAHKPVVSSEIMTNAIEIFNENGLSSYHEVNQKNCLFKQQPPVVKEKFCKSVEHYIIKNIDLDLLIGKWWAQYSTISEISDAWVEWERNPNFTSDYTHIYRLINDNKVQNAWVRVDEPTGYLMVSEDSTETTQEVAYSILDIDYNGHYLIYRCSDLNVESSTHEKLGIYSRSCEFSDSVRARVSSISQDLGVLNKISKIKQYHCLQEYKFQTKILSQKCIQFHDSEIIEPNLPKMVGQWNRHLLSERLPYRYDYALVTHRKDSLDFIVYPNEYHSRKSVVNGTNLLKTMTITKKYAVLGNEAYINVNYSSFVLKYSCAQFEQNGTFKVAELLILSLRPKTSVELSYKPNLFLEILNKTSIKALIRIQHLISKLTHQTNSLYTHFGQTAISSVQQRIQKYRLDNSLSDLSDGDVFKFLRKTCDHFDEDEQIFFDLSTITASNWTLDFTSLEDISYDRFEVKKHSVYSYELSYYKEDILVANSDRYYDKDERVFYAYTEGRRSRKNYLFANSDYRIVYSCDERFTNGQLTAQKILRFYSVMNTRRPRDWFSYLEILVSHLKPKTMGKIADLIENLRPIVTKCDGTRKVPPPLKESMNKFVTPKLKFEEKIRGKVAKSTKPDTEVFEALRLNCKNFDSDEIIEPDLNRLPGVWTIDWTNWIDPSQEMGSYTIDITEPDADSFATNWYFIDSPKSGKKLLSNSYYKRMADNKYYLKIKESVSGPRAQIAFIWSDTDNYLILHQCSENYVNDEIGENEILMLLSRQGSKKSRDLSSYLNLISNLQQKTILKLYHSLNALKPFDINIVAEDMKIIYSNLNNRGLSEEVVTNRLVFAEDLYYKFRSKGLAVDKINKYVVGKQFSHRNEEEVYSTLGRVCRYFNDSELVLLSPKRPADILGDWTIDFTTRTKFSNEFDSFAVDLKSSDSLEIKHYLGNELIKIIEKVPIPNSRYFQTILPNGRQGISAYILLDGQHSVLYWCHENDIDGVLTGKEGLRFSSRDANNTDLETYLNKLLSTSKQSTLSKVVDLVANIRPLDCDIRNRNCQKTKRQKQEKVCEESTKHYILQNKCLYFNQKDLVEPNFRKLLGQWRVRLANGIDFHKPYDTIEWIDSTDRFHSKLRLGQKFQCKGSLGVVDDTNYFEDVFDKRRSIQAILYTDYSELMVIYSCKENFINNNNNTSLPVIENLKLLVKTGSNKISIGIQDFQQLISAKLRPSIYQSIAEFIPDLKYWYNESVTIPPISTQDKRTVIPVQPTLALDEESCPNLEAIAQKNIDFRRLVGRWDAVYTSNNRWDRDCIFTDDSYDRNTDSIIQMKHTNGKRHKVLIRHSETNGKQHIIVDNTIFHSWILATDYNNYRLSYTCYVKIVDGIKRRIDLQRLYTRNIEAIDFNKNLLEILRQKSELIGKTLEPINRKNCLSGQVIHQQF